MCALLGRLKELLTQEREWLFGVVGDLGHRLIVWDFDEQLRASGSAVECS
jgi:hypothetical protein